MKHFLLFYDGATDYLEQRPKFRDSHLSHAWKAQQRGELLLGGAFTMDDKNIAGFLGKLP